MSPTKSPNMGGYKGYICGHGTIESVTYASETCAEIGLSISTDQNNSASINNISTGFITGGEDSSLNPINSINRITFNVETTTFILATLPTSRTSITGVSS